MSNYYIAINENQKGPFTIDELKGMGLNKDTLIWKEGMDTWEKAGEIDELNEVLIKTPPPLPKKEEKIYKVEAEIKKEKKTKINPEAKITAAKEIKTNFNFILYAIIIAIVSFPVFYFVIYNVPKYNNIDYSKIRQVRTPGDIVTYGVPGDLGQGEMIGPNPKSDVRRIVERRKENLTQKSIISSFLTLLIATGVLVIIRYISKGIKWVDETSKK